MSDSLERFVARAQSAEPAWSRARHDGVRAAVERRFAARERRKRTLVVARSSLAGAALLALAVRAFGGSPPDAPGSMMEPSASPAGPQIAYGDGGFAGDVVRD